jgi:PilZ domain
MPDTQQEAPAIEIASLHEADLRRHPRHLCVDAGVLRLSVRPEFRGRRALLIDVSAGGIGFLLKDALEAGTVLVFELKGSREGEVVSQIARVRHSRPHPTPANAPWLPPTPKFGRFFRSLLGMETPLPQGHAWLVGCAFDSPLGENEIKQLVEQLQSATSEPEA